jgi:hypothetical protein
MKDPAYFRARINTIRQLIGEIPVSDEKNNNRVLLRNGFIPEELSGKYETALLEKLQRQHNDPLSCVEQCSFNTWFAMHPEKVAGTEVVTTSREFPITVKGTKEDILQTIGSGLNNYKDKRIRIAKAQAVAKLKLLEIIKI